MLPNEIIDLANSKGAALGIPAGNLPAIIHVESGGKVFAEVDGDLRPLILYESHLFYRKLTGPARDEAVRLGLATRSQRQNVYPRKQADRWAQIAAAQDLCDRYGIDETAALESASYGVGQVLGEHWDELGFASFQDFFDLMTSGAGGQIDIMLRFIKTNGLLDELQEGRWSGFFRGYNGAGYKKLGYDKKIERALRIYGGTTSAVDGMLRMGAVGARVRELQTLLVRAGYQLRVDGDFGPATKKAVMAFQRSSRITVDGIAGPETMKALAKYRQGAEDRAGEQAVTDIDDVKKGAGGVLGGGALEVAQDKIDEATMALQGIDGFQPWLGYGIGLLSVIAAGFAIWGVYKLVTGYLASKRTVEA